MVDILFWEENGSSTLRGFSKVYQLLKLSHNFRIQLSNETNNANTDHLSSDIADKKHQIEVRERLSASLT